MKFVLVAFFAVFTLSSTAWAEECVDSAGHDISSDPDTFQNEISKNNIAIKRWTSPKLALGALP